MAIFRYSVSIGKRSVGKNAVASAAYRHATRLEDTQDGTIKDYSRKQAVEHSEIMAPDSAPDWVQNRQKLWNAVEQIERRKDAQLYREALISLPRELSAEDRVNLVREFAQEQFVEKGMIADIAIHNPLDSDGLEQPHAHVMLTMRDVDQGGFGKKNRDWNATELVEEQRIAWQDHANGYLEKYGQQIDHRSLSEQMREAEGLKKEALKNGDYTNAIKWEAKEISLDRSPEPKLGPVANQMRQEGRGKISYALRDVMKNRLERGSAALRASNFKHAATKWLNQSQLAKSIDGGTKKAIAATPSMAKALPAALKAFGQAQEKALQQTRKQAVTKTQAMRMSMNMDKI